MNSPFAAGETDASLVRAKDALQELVAHDFPWFTLAEGDVATLAHQLKWAKELVDAARGVQSQLEKALARALTDARGPVEIPGLGTVQRRNGTIRKSWDHTLLAPAVGQAVMAVYDADADGPIAEYVAQKLVEAAGLSYWRVGVLRKLGLDPARYCEESYGEPTVQMVVNVTEEAA